jgi:predicted RNase H-like HicB family nuclease
MELIFEIRDAEEGGFFARALGHAIFTGAETWEELRKNILEAVDFTLKTSLRVLDWFNCTTSKTS